MTWQRFLLVLAVLAAAGCSRSPGQRAESLARSLGGRAVFDEERLFRLELQRSRVRDTDLPEFVTWVPDLEEIDLTSTKITDEGIATIARLTSLRKVAISATKISAAALDHLAGLPNLTDLYLVSIPITDDAIPALSKLNRLRKLSVSATQLTAEGVEELRQSMPGVLIVAEALPARPRSGAPKTNGVGSRAGS